jgi:hypothetical protein
MATKTLLALFAAILLMQTACKHPNAELMAYNEAITEAVQNCGRASTEATGKLKAETPQNRATLRKTVLDTLAAALTRVQALAAVGDSAEPYKQSAVAFMSLLQEVWTTPYAELITIYDQATQNPDAEMTGADERINAINGAVAPRLNTLFQNVQRTKLQYQQVNGLEPYPFTQF